MKWFMEADEPSGRRRDVDGPPNRVGDGPNEWDGQATLAPQVASAHSDGKRSLSHVRCRMCHQRLDYPPGNDAAHEVRVLRARAPEHNDQRGAEESPQGVGIRPRDEVRHNCSRHNSNRHSRQMRDAQRLRRRYRIHKHLSGSSVWANATPTALATSRP